jgi:parallel beta-helix repeat protein
VQAQHIQGVLIMGRKRYLNHWLCHAALTGIAAILFSAPAMALECNTVVSESLTLVSDISCSNAGDVGLTVAAGASGITIDLNGHSVTGARKERSIGILVDTGAANITIVNGTLEAMERGMVVSNASGVVASGLVIRNNRRDGIAIRSSNHATVAANEFIANSNGVVSIDSSNLTVLGNTVEKNSNVGFDITGGTDIDLTNNESRKGAQRAAFRIVGPATVSLTANRALGYRGYGYQFADAPIVSDGGGNSARGKKKSACFPDPCPLELK